MVTVSEQMSLDLKKAQIGLQNNSSRLIGTGSSSIPTPASKLPELSANRKSTNISMQSNLSKNVQTSHGSTGTRSSPAGMAKTSKTGQVIKDSGRRPLQKFTSVSFEDEDLDLELTRAGFELYDAIRRQRFRYERV